MVRRVSFFVASFIVLGCGPGPASFDDEAGETQGTSESEDDDVSTTESSMLEAESESGESSEGESSDTSSDDESSDATSSEDESSDDGEGFCGDGRIGRGEQCEGSDLGGYGCVDLGYGGGTLACDPVTCTFDASQCEFEEPTDCGNGVIEIDEECEGDMTVSCEDYGFAGGEATCNAPCLYEGEPVPCAHACKFDLSACLVEGEASPCASEDDCPANVPFCTDDACWNGGEGDPCVEAGDCMPGLECTSAGECWDGSETDSCLIDADCDAGYCAFDHCYGGSWGDPCESSDDCFMGLFWFCIDGYCTAL